MWVSFIFLIFCNVGELIFLILEHGSDILDVKLVIPLNPVVLLSEVPNTIHAISEIPGKLIPNPLQPIIDLPEKVITMPLRIIGTIVSRKK